MKNEMRLLLAIGEIQDEYILKAHGERRVSSRKRIAFAAAIAAILLLLAGCAAFAWHWYATYFTNRRQEPLSGSQIDYIRSNAQTYQLRQSCSGFTLELKSTIAESSTAFVTFGLTAPEDVDLSGVLDIRTEERLSFPGLLAVPEGSGLPADISYDVVDDGDGRKNTLNIVLGIKPMVPQGADSAFGPGKTCVISFRDIVKWGYDWEYEQELLSTKYAGQTDYLLDPEESARLHPQTLLVSGSWSFEVELKEADDGELTLLDSPVTVKSLVTRVGASEYETVDSVEDVTITSIRIRPLSIEISFEPPEPSDTFECVFVDASMFASAPGSVGKNYEKVVLALKDGTKVGLFQQDGARDTAVLRADSPIVLSEVDYLQMSDGTRITANGQEKMQ